MFQLKRHGSYYMQVVLDEIVFMLIEVKFNLALVDHLSPSCTGFWLNSLSINRFVYFSFNLREFKLTMNTLTSARLGCR